MLLFNLSLSDGVSFHALVTRDSEDDDIFSSFVNSVVLGTIFAQENNINRKKSVEMPLLPIQDFSWALRDAVAFSGSYNTIYENNFGDVPERGRNFLNSDGGPQILSFPGIAPICDIMPNKKACAKAGCIWESSTSTSPSCSSA